LNPIISKVLGSFAGGLFGQIGEKVGSWIPSSRQHKRKQIRKLKDEIKKLQSQPSNSDVIARLTILTHKLSEAEKALEEE